MSRAMCLVLLLLSFVLTAAAQETTTSPAQDSGTSKDKPTQAPADVNGHKWHVRLGTIGVGLGYFHGPGFFPYEPYGYYPYYSAALWDPFWSPFYGPFSGAYLPTSVTRTVKAR